MKYVLFVLPLSLLLLSACRSKHDDMEKENEFLKQKIDSLETWITNSFDPIIIENNKDRTLFAGDTANFVVGLLMNDSNIIDSIEMSLYTVKDSNTVEFLQRSIISPRSNDRQNYGVEYFSLPNLHAGDYLYRGFIVFKGKSRPVEHYFSVQ